MNNKKYSSTALVLSLLLLLFSQHSLAQNWVINYQKISNTEGNLGNILNTGDAFGNSLDSIGDIDGDGVTDIIITAFSDDQAGLNLGAFYVLKLNNDGTVKSSTKITKNIGGFNGNIQAGDIFGSGCASLGDYNYDGNYDVAIGAEYDDDGGTQNGAFYIVSIDSSGNAISTQKISATSGGFTGTLTGPSSFGCDIANIGDLNSDGIDDLAVGSRQDSDGGTGRGAIWILFMNSNGTVNHHQKISSTQGNFSANLNDNDHFGVSVEFLGDLNNDGHIEIGVGCHFDDDGGTNKGSIYILSLDTNGTVISHSKISDSSIGFTGTLSLGGKFGVSISKIGDLDNNGVTDIAVGSYTDNTVGYQTGAVYFLYLYANGTVKSHLKITEGFDGFNGDLDNDDLFGVSCASIGKFGDFFTLLVGTRWDDDGVTDAGAAYMLFIRGQINPGINNIVVAKDLIYNNPVQDVLYLKTETSNSTFYLYDISAKLIKQKRIENKELQMDVTLLSKGLYIGVIENNDYRKSIKLIIE